MWFMQILITINRHLKTILFHSDQSAYVLVTYTQGLKFGVGDYMKLSIGSWLVTFYELQMEVNGREEVYLCRANSYCN